MAVRNIGRGDGVDKMSSLPVDVLVRILSLIPTEEAVTTSLLSKRWKSIWTLLPNLDFDFVRFSRKFDSLSLDNRKTKFFDFLEHVFLLHELQPLQELRLAFDIAQFDDYIGEVSLLVKSALRCNCLTIDLDFTNQDELSSLVLRPKYNELYTLPSCSFPHQSVSQLKLTGCKFVPSYKRFTSFTVVKLTIVKLQKDSVHDLLYKCPCLEELHLIRCEIPSPSFEINAPESSVKCLVLHNCVGSKELYFRRATVHIPTLLKLKFQGLFSEGYLSVQNPENLIEAEINIAYCSTNDEYKPLCKLLKSLQNVKSLTLSSTNLKVLNTSGGINLLSSFHNLKHLTVNLPQADKDILGLICLLRSSPCLETLFINFHLKYETNDEMLSAVYDVDDEAVPQPHLLPSECVAHLMKIKVGNFRGLKLDMEFVKNLLQSSLCLKEMVICIDSRYHYLKNIIGEERYMALKKKKAKTIERLLACKRASPDAQIILEW